MNIGLLNICANPVTRRPSKALEEWIRIGVEGERMGYWSYWTAEHHFQSDRDYQPFLTTPDEYPIADYDTVPDPFTLLSYAAAKTTTLRLGTAVTVPHWDHPIRLAERAALVDALSGGRLEWGVGRGLGFREAKVFGVPSDPEASRRRYQEAIEILRRAWTGEHFTFEGEFYSVPEPVAIVPKPERQPIPLWIASASNESAVFAAQNDLAYATSTWPLTTLERYQEKKRVYEQAAVEAGVDVSRHRIPYFLHTYCAESESEAAEVGHHYMTQFQYIFEGHYEVARRASIGDARAMGPEADRLAIQIAREADGEEGRRRVDEHSQVAVDYKLIGTPAQLIERIEEYKRDVDINYLVCNIGFGAMPTEKTLASMELFAKEVMPHFADDAAVLSA